MHTNRRQFLNVAAGSTAALGFTHCIPNIFLRAAERIDSKRTDNILVVVQLTGGNDGLNTVIPFTDDEYYKNRYSLGIGKNAVRKINDSLGFHSQMQGFAKLMDDGLLSVIQGVGYPQPNRSHFESMDLWHTAHNKHSRIPEGWLGKYFETIDQAGDVPGIHFGSEDQPLALAAPNVRVPSIRSLESFQLEFMRSADHRQAVRQLAERSASGDSLIDFLQTSTQSAIQTSQQIEKIVSTNKGKSSVNYPELPLGRKLQTIAQLIAGDLPSRVYYVSLDGFDTHANQPEAHGGLLGQLSNSIAAFTNDLQEQGNLDRVSVMVFSEFGRRVKQNASQGTDHGAAAPMFLVGGKVKAEVIGRHPSLTDLDDGDLKFHTDYRQVYATILEKWLGVDSEAILQQRFDTLNLYG
jgi:uncharacterized protein (DUF1501 family)